MNLLKILKIVKEFFYTNIYMSILQVKKRNTTFQVCGDYSVNWFNGNINNGKWEEESFDIFDNYANKDKIYIDIGAWIGPTVLYNYDKYKQLYCFEPDPVALSNLKNNININNIDNVTLIEKALSNNTGTTKFGGNGKLGNSMSTLLVGFDNDFFNDYGRPNQFLKKEDRMMDIIDVETITMDKFIEDYNINPIDIGLIKMDIEGGEYVVLPHIVNFLRQYKPIFFISLHYVFLPENKIQELLDLLFDIYNNCYIFYDNIKRKIDKTEAINKKYTSLVFESNYSLS